MASTHVDIDAVEWQSAVPFFGPGAIHEGQDLVRLKVLCDRRHEGGGITWLLNFMPPPGKLIKVVAIARSDEHIVNLQGGRSTKSGQPVRAANGYGLNTKGQPHSAMIATETLAIVIYTGEPDEVTSVELIDISSSAEQPAA
jgi:hypothetical protein